MAHSHTARPRHCTATARIARYPAPSRCGSRPSALGLPSGGRKAARRALRIERHRTQPPKTPVRRDLAPPVRRPAPRAPHPHARTSPKHAVSAGPYCAQRAHVPARGRYTPCRAVVRWVASHSPCRSGREYASPQPKAAPLPPGLDENAVLHAESWAPSAPLYPDTSSTRSFAEARFSPANYLRANRHSRTSWPRFRATSARTARYRVSSRVAPLGPRVAFGRPQSRPEGARPKTPAAPAATAPTSAQRGPSSPWSG